MVAVNSDGDVPRQNSRVLWHDLLSMDQYLETGSPALPDGDLLNQLPAEAIPRRSN
jgi:hypothetical protein